MIANIDFDIDEEIFKKIENKEHLPKENIFKQNSSKEVKEKQCSSKEHEIKENKTHLTVKKHKLEHSSSLFRYDREIYPLFKNYDNGSLDYYIKLKSIDHNKWKKDLKIFFYKTKNFQKYSRYLTSLQFNITNNDYNLIISNSIEALKMPSNIPIILINCEPNYFIDKQRKILFFFDNKKLYEKVKNNFNEFDIVHRLSYCGILDAISKIHTKEGYYE